MRVILMIVGFIVALNGAVWAMQGAYLVPASFMRGPEWIAIGAVVCVVGLILMWYAGGTKPAGAVPGQ
jgi:hypothetical protein